MSIVQPLPAATVIIRRRRSDGAREMFLVKRHSKSAFMAGVHVFPGGRVEVEDALTRVDNIDVTLGKTRADAAAFVAAAVREAHEECGCVLWRDADIGRVIDGAHLQAYAWWVTPEAEPKRFDTVFFIADVDEAVLEADGVEVTDGVWMTAIEALAAYQTGEIALAPPTLATLEDLAADRGPLVDALGRLRPIMPVLAVGPPFVLALPGDVLHDDKEAVFAKRTRIVRDGAGKWMSV